MEKQTIAPKTSLWSDTAVRQAILIFIVLRIFLSVWGVVAITVNPPPEDAPDIISQQLGQPSLNEGWTGLLLGPWQRFDSLRYTRIAAEGYAHEPDSAFPPLYPLGMRLLGRLLGGTHASYLLAGILISNAAFIGLLILLHKVTEKDVGPRFAPRTVLYLAVFPASFFLLAAYSESLFLLLALGSLWAGRQGRFGLAGGLGFLASLTRLTGWVLVVPLAYEFWRQRLGRGKWRIRPAAWSPKLPGEAFAVLLPGLGTLSFMVYRQIIGMPPLNQLYANYWYQDTSFPGIDVWRAVQAVFFGVGRRAGDPAMVLDLAIVILLFVTTILAFRYLPRSWGLYAAIMLFFILLPSAPLKPLYSFSRYALAFFTLFFILGIAGQRPWLHRLILYPFAALLLYFSMVFFMWGWVA